MNQEEAADLRYEAGMYQSLYELAKERNGRLVAALDAIAIDPSIAVWVRNFAAAALKQSTEKP